MNSLTRVIMVIVLSAISMEVSGKGLCGLTRNQYVSFTNRLAKIGASKDYRGLFKLANEFHHDYHNLDGAELLYKKCLHLSMKAGIKPEEEYCFLGDVCSAMRYLYKERVQKTTNKSMRTKYDKIETRFYSAAMALGHAETVRKTVETSIELYEKNRSDEHSVIYGQFLAEEISPSLKKKYPDVWKKATAIIKEVYEVRNGAERCRSLENIRKKRDDSRKKAFDTIKDFMFDRM